MSNFRNGKPALSIIAAGRNDDHGGNLLRRMQMFINGILAQSQQYRLSVELVLVEWNPPQDKPRLAEVLSFPEQGDYCTIRIIQVPAEVHNRYKHSDGLALYQMIAKNVGIRRAQGEFILATNIDILFSDELFAFFASGKMRRGKMYRVDRYDVDNKVLQQPTVSEQLAFCRENIIRINKRNGTQNLITGDYHMIYPPKGEDVPRLRTKRAHLHTNGCGDFQLLHRDHWFSLHGYPEFDKHSFHLDSLLSFMAHYGGAEEEALSNPMCIYHIEHSAGWTPEIHKKGILWKNLEARKVERISNAQFDAYAVKMTEERKPIIFNNDNWGLEVEEFEEDVPVRAEFDVSNSKSVKQTISVTESSENPGSPVNRSVDEKYLSIVVTSRNDDYDANILHRMQTSAKGLAEQCRRFNLDAELIIVEWNPPADRKRLYEVLDWPDDLDPLTVRFIEVPAEIHNSIGNSDKLPLFQMIAKNVGIRRARGKFVLATNIDILFSNELMQFLASGRLDENCFYRIDRHDVGSKIVPEHKDINEQLEFCRNNIVRVQGLYGTKKISEIESDHFIYNSKDKKLHTNGCGDFTLMSCMNWHLFRAYPELPRWSIYVDGLLLHMAYVSGLHQVILPEPMRIYHIEHDMSWSVTDESKQKLATERYPSLNYQKEYLVWCQQMIEAGKPITNNDEHWGYAQTEFKEHVISGRWKGQMTDKNATLQDNNRKLFQEWIDILALTQNRLYYRDQTPESLNMLVELVHSYKPTKIVELGTLSGFSLRAWLSAKSEAEVIAIDLSFKPLFRSQEVLPVELSGVRLLEQDILKTDFRRLWSEEDRVLLYIDAHDQLNTSIMTHILDNALPLLPQGSIVTVDDLWYCPEAVSNDTVSRFFEEITTNETDSLQCFEGYYASYWKGGFFGGFREVIPLMEWVNRNKVELILNPGDKAVTFKCPALRKNAGKSFDAERFRTLTGGILYNPVDIFSIHGGKEAKGNRGVAALCETGAQFYACGRIKEAINCFKQATLLKSDISGAFYAQAVCFAREGNFEKATESLRMEIENEFCHPRAQRLYKDIQQYILRKHKPISKEQQKVPTGNITIFALPKAFTDTFATIQENALKSWMQLRPCPEIILFGNDKGVSEFAQEYNLKHIPNVQRNEFGTPLLNDLFLKAQTAATNEICVYINADIILMNDFVEALDKVGTEFDQFLMIGRRWDIDITEPVEFDNEKWQEHLRMQVKMAGSLHLDRGIDYFAFRKGLWRQIPPFGIGRTAWDNWLVYAPLSEGKDVVDATEAVTVVHQNHNFSHITGGKETPRFQFEVQQNREIAGPVVLMGVGAASDATWRLTKDGLVRNKPEGYNTHLNDLCSKLLEKGWDKKYNLYKKYFHSAQSLKQIKKPCISIVVISWRFHPDTVKNFEALAQQRDDNFELIFVNNGTTNDEFKDLIPFIDTYIKLNQNTGAYLARNIGALFAKAPILLFLDDDGIAETDIVRAYLRNFEKYDVIAVRGAVWPKERGAGPYSAHRYYGSKPFPYFSCQEGNTAYKASVFYQVSGWDDEISWGHGGIDLSRRLMEIEPDMRKQMYSPEPVIHHDPVKDKIILEEKTRKQKISAKRLERKHPDLYVFQRRFNEYLQREDLLIHKDAYRGSYADMKGPDEHIYHFRDIVRHNPALQRAQPDTKKVTTSIKSGKELSAATDVNNKILAEESFRKGFRHLCKGDASEAIKYLEKAADNYTILPNLHYAIAAAYAELGDIFSSKKACEIELSLQPDNSGAWRLLKRIEKQINESVSISDSNRCMVNGTTTEKYLNLKHNSNIFNFRKAIEKHCLPGTKRTGEKVLLQSAEKSNERLKMQVIGTEYGGWAVDLDLIPFGSTVVSAGVGEDISFDLGLINLKNCRIIGIDPTEKARRYIENNKNEHFDFLQKALYSESNKKIRIYKNTNPNYVSESITPSHKSVSEANFYEAESISIGDILNKYKNVSVLKMDIEGAEYEVLNSISKLDIPQICIEFHHFCTDFTADDTEKCIKHLQRMGYVLAHRKDECGTVKEATFVHQKYVSKKTAEMNIGEPETYVTKDIPVILVCYTRPKHTLEVLKALREHNIKNIYIFSDAPKSHEDEEAVSLTRHLVHSIDWTKPKIIERTENLGLARNIVSAVDYVFEKCDRLILLEDDCVPQRYFFDFMHTCLEKYENNQRVFGISGYTVQIPDKILSDYPYDLYFCPRIGSWGWATWKRAWQHYKEDIYELIEIAIKNDVDIDQGGTDIPISIENFLNGQLKDVWTLNWVLSVYANNGVYIYPTRSHICNIGTDGTGAHCGKTDKYDSSSYDTRTKRYPAEVFLDERVMENFKSYYRALPERSRSAVHFLRSLGPKKSLKIAQVSTIDKKGGAAKVAWMLKEGLKARGLGTQMFVGQKLSNDPDVKIITDSILDSGTYYKSQGYVYYDVKSTFMLASKKEFLESDIVHFHNLHGDYFNPLALPDLTESKPSVWTLHDMQSMTGHCAYSFDCEKWQTGCGNCPDLEAYPSITKDRTAEMWHDKKIIYKESDLELIVPSQWLKNIVEKSILKDKRVHLIYNGIDESIYRPLDKHAIRKMFKIPPNAVIISFVAHGGLIDKRKGGNFILEAYRYFTAKYPNVFFICVGGTSDKAPTERFLQIPFVLDEDKLVQLYCAADIFLFPTLADNCPLVILEVMGCGIPIVSFNTGGIPELIDHGQTGLIAGFRNREEFIKMTEYLVADKAKREELSAAGRERLLKTFTLDQMVDKHITLYERLAEQGKKENYILPKNKVSLPTAVSDKKYKYLVSAIVSIYNSEKFIRRCLEDLENQTIADKLEIIVINSGSQENEETIVKEFQQRYDNIKYIKTEQREGIYAAWNRAVKVARGTFLTNANTDDRHREDALEVMAETLLANPDVALVYGDQICTDTPNGTFANHHAIEMARRAEYSHERLLFGCCVGSQPMWRKSLHTELGYFDETLTCAGDWDFWLRISISSRYKFKHIPEFLGLYYYNENGIEHGRKIHSLYERYIVGKRYGNPYISVIPLYTSKENPLVSVIMTVYNCAEYIGDAIESVLIQNYPKFELIIINDGSTDSTKEVISRYEDQRIRYFYQENAGMSNALNHAVRQARGQYIMPLDADDMMFPSLIAKHLSEFEKHPDADLVYCDVLLIDGNSKPIRIMNKPEYQDRRHLIRDLFRAGHPVVPFRLGIKRTVYDKIGLYDEKLKVGMDYDMMRRFVEAGLKEHHLSEPLHLRRMHADSLSGNQSAQKAKSHFEVIKRFIDTFAYDELFPDVAWDEIAPQMRQLHAKCLAAGTYLAIGQDYVKTKATECSRTAFDLACSELNDCVKMEPGNQDLRQLLQKSKLIRARYTEAPQQVVSK